MVSFVTLRDFWAGLVTDESTLPTALPSVSNTFAFLTPMNASGATEGKAFTSVAVSLSVWFVQNSLLIVASEWTTAISVAGLVDAVSLVFPARAARVGWSQSQ